MSTPSLLPDDEFNRELLSQAHPPTWQNPTPSGVYNLVAIGGGTAGIISALGTAGLGGKVALVERHLLGGDCLNYGCVPSKALLRAARAAHDARDMTAFGVTTGEVSIDFASVMQRMRKLRAGISHHDSAQRFTGMGVDVYLGDAKFLTPDSLSVAGQTLRFRRCVIATGRRAAIPPVPGLIEAGCLTNESVFSLTELPQRLAVIGGGAIGCELAQAFRRYGSEVTLLQRSARLLPRDEPAASELIQQQFSAEGIRVVLNANLKMVETRDKLHHLAVDVAGHTETFVADKLLVAAGRQPNLEGLDLAAAQVEQSKRGVEVDDFLRTSNPHILAAGDIIGSYQFTHAAEAMARFCIQNAFFFGRKRLSQLVIPRTTYVDPEVASIGLTAAQCAEQNIAIDTYREELRNVDRAILDGETNGFALIHCQRGSGKVVGGTIVARHAGEMIGELSLLMTHSLSLGNLSGTVHCYPTQVDVLKRLGDQYNKTRLTPTIAGWLRWILRKR